MRIKLNEHGRSMIEILGVLAIIGILSIGGMAGYQYAYSSYQAGQIQDVIGKAKLLATQNNRSSHIKEVRRFVENMLSKYKPSDTIPMVTHRDGKYIVDLFNISDSVCEKLQNRRDIFNSMRIGMTPEACTTAEMNMQFTFDSIVIGRSSSGGAESGYDDPNNPDIGRCPDKQVWRQKEDGTYGCVCRHSFEYGEDCTRCEPPREWSASGCYCPPDKPIFENENCICKIHSDCTYNTGGFCCDSQTQSCRNCVVEDCDTTKGQVLSNGKCICSGLKTWDIEKNECVCRYIPKGGNTQTCMCPEGQDDIDGVCQESCPYAPKTGLTGYMNSENQCLCDTSKGYKSVADKIDGGWVCQCDNTKDYYPSSSGGCKRCEQTTVEWCNKRNAAGEIDCTYIDTSNWYCGDIQKNGVADGYIAFYVWNPSTKSYCGAHSTLRKNADGSFYCYRCDSALPLHLRTNRNGEGRASENGFCACSGYWAWYNGVNGWRCYPRCAVGKYYYPGINVGNGTSCSGCSNVQVALNGQCNSEALTNQYCADSTTKHGNKFWWGLWKANTPESCRNGVNIAQDPTPGSVCDVRKGCVYEQTTLVGCEFGTKITTTCACSTGGSVGQYCCSYGYYSTDSGCVACTAGTVPSEDKKSCVACKPNEIAQDGICKVCPTGYIPSATQIRCYACPNGKTSDETGTTCICPAGTIEDFDFGECILTEPEMDTSNDNN